MKNIIFKTVKYIYYLSFIILLVLYLFPGSLVGFFLYNDLAKQPNLISNPFGTSINHTMFFFYLSIQAFIINIKYKKFIYSFPFLLCVSILFELFHIIIPNRAFEAIDLFGNITGVVLAYLILNIIKKIEINL